MAGDGGRVPDVSEQRAEDRPDHEHCLRCGYMRTPTAPCKCGELATPRPASVLAALLAESPEATVAAIEALLTNERVIGRVARRIRQDSADTYDWQRVARWAMESACRSLLSKAPKEDGDA